LLCTLVLAPDLYSRNRFFDLFRDNGASRVRTRARVLRGIIRQLVGHDGHRGHIVGEQVLWDDQVLLRYELSDLDFIRTVALSPLEAALVRYALFRAGAMGPDPEATRRIEEALAEMKNHLPNWGLETKPSEPAPRDR
jgi:hypothetical protein